MGIIARPILLSLSALLFLLAPSIFAVEKPGPRPNIILCMADDLGWGDVGYNGHPALRTPNLDRMASEGVRFDRFYSASPVCSPTRGSCLTGRHPNRLGIFGANDGSLSGDEIHLARILKTEGYTTGHFGKWHLGTLTTEEVDSNRGRPGDERYYAPPWDRDFDVCFSTEAKVPTWDPMKHPDHPDRHYGTFYWTGPGEKEQDNLEGDDSRVIMDRAIPFIREAVKDERPFFAVVWFHTPHHPVVAGPDYRAMYPDEGEGHQHYYGCITALDEQIGRLRSELNELGVHDETMLWFCSDNGPAGIGGGTDPNPGGREHGTAGPFRGRKGSVYEGGVRVPGLLVWPEGFPEPMQTDFPSVTTDYLPTILDALNIELPASENRSYDGVSLLPALHGEMGERPRPIGFELREKQAWTANRYKIVSIDSGETFALYDLEADPAEAVDLAQAHPEVLSRMKKEFESWREDCRENLNPNRKAD